MNNPIRIILVEDHLLFRIGIRSVLENCHLNLSIVAEAESKKQFLEIIQNQKFDIILLDIILPDGTGIEISQYLRKNYPEIKILILSSDIREETIAELIEIGIDGFISKLGPVEELCKAIDYINNGAVYYGQDIAKTIHFVKVARHKDKLHEFTHRENEIIEMCANVSTRASA